MVNVCWVLCLANSLEVAAVAITVQQWSRRYLRFSQPSQRGARTRARTRALFAGSVDKRLIRIFSIWLPCSVHVSIFLFVAGLLIFVFDINHVLFIHTLWYCVLATTLYSVFTALPLFQPDCILYTPMSVFPAATLGLIVHFFRLRSADRFKFKTGRVFEWILEDKARRVPKKLSSSSESDLEILESTLDSLDEDETMEKVFRSIPDLFSSKGMEPTSVNLSARLQGLLKEVLYEFLDNTFRSTTIAESVKSSRLIIGLDASHAALGPNGPSWILGKILDRTWPDLLRSVEIGHSLSSRAYGNGKENALLIRTIISHIVASSENRNDRWLTLAGDRLSISEEVLRDYLGHGDSVLLANLINITRLTFRSHPPNWKFHPLPSKFDVSSALPSLQHDFCALWNEIALEAPSGKGATHTLILDDIRPVYFALHSGTDASPKEFSAATTDTYNVDRASSYPLCNITSHRSDATPQGYNEAVKDVSLAIHSRIHSVTHHSPGPVLVSDTRTFDMPAHRTARDPADKSFGDVSDASQPNPSVSFLDASVAPFMANVDRYQSETIVFPSIVYDSPSMFDPPCTDSSS